MRKIMATHTFFGTPCVFFSKPRAENSYAIKQNRSHYEHHLIKAHVQPNVIIALQAEQSTFRVRLTRTLWNRRSRTSRRPVNTQYASNLSRHAVVNRARLHRPRCGVNLLSGSKDQADRAIATSLVRTYGEKKGRDFIRLRRDGRNNDRPLRS